MKAELNASRSPFRPENAGVFWSLVIMAVIFTTIGIFLGNSFEDYQTASTL